MRKKIFTILSVSFLVLFVALFVGLNSTANSLTIEEKFEKAGFEKVSDEEMMGDYSFDKAHSSINFRVKHMGLVDVPGHFRNFEGTINLDGKKLKDSSVEFKAMMKSVDTGVNGRDKHLRSKDFFEVEKFPEMTFKSTSIKKKGKTYRVTGDFTMKGVTKEIKIPMKVYGPIKDGRGTIKMGVAGQMTINRRDFGVNYGRNLPNGTPMLSDIVTVDLQIESVKRKEKK